MSSKKYLTQIEKCEILSRVALEIGNFGNEYKNINEEVLAKYYPDKVIPYFNDITVGNVKWYLKEKLEWEHDIWNGDFLKGLTKVGHVQYCPMSFPRFHWSACPHIWDMIDNSPFGGKKYKPKNKMSPSYWNSVPALYLPGTKNSIHYVAGLMAGLEKIQNSKGITYARISAPLLPYIKELGIPIDYKTKHGIEKGISPIWPMLFKKYMPIENTQWEDVKNPLMGEEYAMILWKTYVSNKFISEGIPFLPSRRTVFYRHKQNKNKNGIKFWRGREIGALRSIEKMRLDYHIVNLNPYIIQMTREYGKDSFNKC